MPDLALAVHPIDFTCYLSFIESALCEIHVGIDEHLLQ
jgi:hypothetical protein